MDAVEQIEHAIADVRHSHHDHHRDACRNHGVFDRRGAPGCGDEAA